MTRQYRLGQISGLRMAARMQRTEPPVTSYVHESQTVREAWARVYESAARLLRRRLERRGTR